MIIYYTVNYCIYCLTKLINPISTIAILNYTIIHYTMLYYMHMCLYICYIYYQETAKGSQLHDMGGFTVFQGVQERNG